MQHWRYSAVSVTKYNPAFRNDDGVYQKNEWIGFFQVGKEVEGRMLTFDDYSLTEEKYIAAATLFFQFHGCKSFRIENLEKNHFGDYAYADKEKLSGCCGQLESGQLCRLDELEVVVKLILREMIWAELFCEGSDEIAVRFGYDFYMYFNARGNMSDLFRDIELLGLYVD